MIYLIIKFVIFVLESNLAYIVMRIWTYMYSQGTYYNAQLNVQNMAIFYHQSDTPWHHWVAICVNFFSIETVVFKSVKWI